MRPNADASAGEEETSTAARNAAKPNAKARGPITLDSEDLGVMVPNLGRWRALRKLGNSEAGRRWRRRHPPAGQRAIRSGSVDADDLAGALAAVREDLVEIHAARCLFSGLPGERVR